ncbi:uncharacterized protein LOC130390633 [Gadus chalcogrammus]|uniref:uncharacterized protein LOC130390633 n=1 Tax=Gadus chalcogrammus TaxID=1042646 RepID=UPI0024C27D33|nr:uncharacterized protein LOC130390633 [Gadus chalcogrammus]
MRMWGIPSKCPQCSSKMNSSGIYRKLALDRKVMTFLKPRTSGNSSSYLQSVIAEGHSEEWARQTIRYLADCELHKKMATFVPSAAIYPPPPPFRPLPLAQWFETVHSNDILSHVEEMKGVITSTYGRILKMDSTKKLMATISSAEMKRHCRRRTRGVEEMRSSISGLLESVWELTDTTGLRLVSHDSMRHVWEVQQKHLECLQDPAGVALYTKVGTLQKGGKELDILRCGRGSSSLESFHRHQCAFIPGWRCNAVHMQMYMLEGISRWNMGRAKEAVDVEGASTLRSFDVRLMSHLNNLSQHVHGCALVPEFTLPGKPTGERIAVEYLLEQTNRGDLLAPSQASISEIPLPVLEEEEEEEEDDAISMPAISVPAFSVPAISVPAISVPAISMPAISMPAISMPASVTETSQCDSRGVPGWDAVDALAAYLLALNRTITALSAKEEADIVRLYAALHAMDRKPSRYKIVIIIITPKLNIHSME